MTVSELVRCSEEGDHVTDGSIYIYIHIFYVSQCKANAVFSYDPTVLLKKNVMFSNEYEGTSGVFTRGLSRRRNTTHSLFREHITQNYSTVASSGHIGHQAAVLATATPWNARTMLHVLCAPGRPTGGPSHASCMRWPPPSASSDMPACCTE